MSVHHLVLILTKDKAKAAEDQLYRYLNQYQKHYGILPNGKVWRSYDKKFKVSGREINKHILASILEESIFFILRIFFIAYIEDNDIFKKILEENRLYRSSISFIYFFMMKMQKRN